MRSEEEFSLVKTWSIIGAIAAGFLAWGLLIYFVIGDKGPPDWDFSIIPDIPGQSAYSTYSPARPARPRSGTGTGLGRASTRHGAGIGNADRWRRRNESSPEALPPTRLSAALCLSPCSPSCPSPCLAAITAEMRDDEAVQAYNQEFPQMPKKTIPVDGGIWIEREANPMELVNPLADDS